MTNSKQPRIGLIGLGRMGRALAERLIEQDVPLRVWNRTAGRTGHLPGVEEVGSPAALALGVDLILVIVRDDTALRDVYESHCGLASVALGGKTVVEMSTASIGAIKAALGAAAAAGAAVIDAPVSGSVIPARRGELLVMVGGQTAALQTARPVLQRVARRVVHVGALGTGITMKLVLNLLLASYWQALGEALGLGMRNGLALEELLAVIVDSKAAIGALPGKIDRILDPSLPPEFDLAGLCKDVTIICESTRAVGLEAPGCAAALQSATKAVAAGLGGRDLAQLIRFVGHIPDPIRVRDRQ
jgi:3-hydroxyisobutyrate dehydrogenase